jgi:hypothetical protein
LSPRWASRFVNTPRAVDKMDHRLNFFVPYERSPASHENQLTRALLVVLRYSPMAHQAWLGLISRNELHLQNLPKAEFATQRGRVLSDTDVSDGEAVQGISVWLAPDAAPVNTPIESSDRQQVLDGVVTYGNELVVVIENKISWGRVTDQPHRINLHGSAVKFDKSPISVRWQDLLDAFSDLVDRDDLVPLAERLLISDFFDLVEDYFPSIGPYSTLVRCGNQRFRLERRLDAIQGEVAGTNDGKALGWRNIAGTPKIFMAWLGLSDDQTAICLQMYPADTLGQARAFYVDPASVHSVLALRAEGWTVAPSFHWGFTAAGYAWSNTPLSVDRYCEYWLKGIGTTREVNRLEWEAYWAKLESDHIVEAAAKEAFDAAFTRSQRQKASPRPGLRCEYQWPLANARNLDDHGKFVDAVRARLNQMLHALRARPVSPASALTLRVTT